MEKSREFRQPLYLCFVDLRKAYDSVNRSALWCVLQKSFGLPSKLVSIIQALHEGTSAAVRVYNKLSEDFQVTTGVLQGCVLAPTLFNLYMFFDAVTRMAISEHEAQGRGVHLMYLPASEGKLVGNRKRLKLDTVVSDLEYADDMALVSSSWDDLRVMVQALEKHCTDMHLCISTKKTKIMAVLPYPSCQPPEPTTLLPDEDPIKVIYSFQYLGSILENN